MSSTNEFKQTTVTATNGITNDDASVADPSLFSSSTHAHDNATNSRRDEQQQSDAAVTITLTSTSTTNAATASQSSE